MPELLLIPQLTRLRALWGPEDFDRHVARPVAAVVAGLCAKMEANRDEAVTANAKAREADERLDHMAEETLDANHVFDLLADCSRGIHTTEEVLEELRHG